MSYSLSLDHVGYVGRDFAAMAANMRRLGLAPTEPKLLSARDAVTGAPMSLDQSSCHCVLAQGYLELTAVSTDDPAHHLAAWREHGLGVHILAFGSPQPQVVRAQCVVQSLEATAVARASRPIDYGPLRGEAQFDWFMLSAAAAPEALLCVANNLRPELIYQAAVTANPLGALALDEVTVLCADPAAFQAKHAGWLGGPWSVDGAWRFVPLVAGGRLSVCDAAAARARWGAPFDQARWRAGGIAAIGLRVANLDLAQALLQANGVRFSRHADEISVPADEALGAVLLLRN
jgi:hypothetical protein